MKDGYQILSSRNTYTHTRIASIFSGLCKACVTKTATKALGRMPLDAEIACNYHNARRVCPAVKLPPVL